MAVNGSYQDHNLIQFSDELLDDVQQRGSVLINTVMQKPVMGKQAYFEKQGKATSYTKTERGQAKTFFDKTFERRLLDFKYLSSDHLMDEVDKLDMVNYRPEDTIRTMSWELGRQIDDVIADAIQGSASVQTNGTVASTPLPAASKIAVNDHTFDPAGGTNDIGLTPFKLRNALKILQETFAVNPMTEEVIVVGSANVLTQLTTFDEVINADYRATKPVDSAGLIGSGIQGYLNLNFIAYEYFDNVNTTDEAVYVFPKSAIYLGMRQPLKVEIGPDYSRVGNPDTISATMDLGAVRMYEEKVIQIACDPSVIVSA